jgi:hypothetical protein
VVINFEVRLLHIDNLLEEIIINLMTVENLGDVITYRGSFNSVPIKKILGLGGGVCELPQVEQERLASMLLRAGCLAGPDMDVLFKRGMVLEDSRAGWVIDCRGDQPCDR